MATIFVKQDHLLRVCVYSVVTGTLMRVAMEGRGYHARFICLFAYHVMEKKGAYLFQR